MYAGLFRNHLIPALGGSSLSAISVEDIQALKAAKLRAGLSPQTVKHILRLLRQMLAHAVDWGYLRSSPAKKVTFPRIPRAEMDFLTPDEVQVFISRVPTRWQALFITAITTGVRIGELLAMKWENLDVRSKHYHVRRNPHKASWGHCGRVQQAQDRGVRRLRRSLADLSGCLAAASAVAGRRAPRRGL